MPAIRSKLAGGSDRAPDVTKAALLSFAENFPHKLAWFLSHKQPYQPHAWQLAFHAAATDGRLSRYRHLVAGRRGGKTLSAAWEVLFYCLHPQVFHRDAHGTDSDRSLWVWALAKDHEVGRPSRVAFLEAIAQAGLIPNKDYRYNKTERIVEFANGSIVHFRTAEDPQSLRGAGLDILWIDEAAFIPTKEAYEVARPALADKLGIVITTTTPKGKNWLWETFWCEKAVADPRQFRVEYTSIDNPYFHKEEWLHEKENQHPILFKQEYLAAFDAMSGVELHGDWLHYFVIGDPEHPGDVTLPRGADGRLKLKKFVGIDPAVSLADRADHFAMACVGVHEESGHIFILDTFKDRVPFPDQLDKIREWHLKHRPQYIGIESNAFQKALVQQAVRLDGLPTIIPVLSRGKKVDRILAMAPIFKIGQARIHRHHSDFIEEWVGYDSTLKNAKDDLLDAVEIALGVAGVLLPREGFAEQVAADLEPGTPEEEAWQQVMSLGKATVFDPDLGSEA